MKTNFLHVKKTIFSLFLLLFSGSLTLLAEETSSDTLYAIVEQSQSDLKVLKRLKISGYIQTQYQKADTAGIASMAGGNFASGIDNRFAVRRGRVKFTYDDQLSKGIVQFDITEKGLAIKDAYLSFTEPWLRTASLTAGVFDRPFGYEISYSSIARETPERSRVYQTLFPGERENGMKLSLRAPKTSNLNFLSLEAGLFNGNGPAAVESDKYKDFIGRASASKTSSNQMFKWGVGTSYYNGGFASTTTSHYQMKKVDDVNVFVAEAFEKGEKLKREYWGVDAQLSVETFLGLTQVRAEYLMGIQPATAKSSSSLTGANVLTVQTANETTGVVSSSTQGVDTYSRHFNGFYVYFIQNVLQTPFQVVIKYDVYDPNTDVDGNNIGKTQLGSVATTSADLKYSTLGVGLNYRWNSHVKLMAYYDMVTNETSDLLSHADPLKNFSKDLKDNVFTFRIQYKF